MAVSGLLALLLLIPVFIAGVTLLTLGLRGRLADALPYCRRCRFCLEGLPTGSGAACPECGSSLGEARAVRVGRRRKRPVMLGVGALCLLLTLAPAAGVGVMWARGFNWNTIKPVWLLEMDAGSANVSTSSGIWAELTSRLSGGSLESETARRLSERALALQADASHPWTVEVGDYIEAARQVGLVSDRHWAEYYERGMSLSARVRAEVRQGSHIPIMFGGGGTRLGSGGGLGLRSIRQTLRTPDGREVAQSQGSAFLGINGGGGTGWIGTSMTGDLPVGEHELILVVDVALAPGYQAEPFAEFQREFPITVTVVPAERATAHEQADSPIDAQVRAAITISDLRVNTVRNGAVNLYLGLKASNLPIGCAFDIFAVLPAEPGAVPPPPGTTPANSREVHVGTITFSPNSGQHATGRGIEIDGFNADTMTLILRPSIQAAEQTVDIFEIYGKELRFENHAVSWPEGVERP